MARVTKNESAQVKEPPSPVSPRSSQRFARTADNLRDTTTALREEFMQLKDANQDLIGRVARLEELLEKDMQEIIRSEVKKHVDALSSVIKDLAEAAWQQAAQQHTEGSSQAAMVPDMSPTADAGPFFPEQSSPSSRRSEPERSAPEPALVLERPNIALPQGVTSPRRAAAEGLTRRTPDSIPGDILSPRAREEPISPRRFGGTNAMWNHESVVMGQTPSTLLTSRSKRMRDLTAPVYSQYASVVGQLLHGHGQQARSQGNPTSPTYQTRDKSLGELPSSTMSTSIASSIAGESCLGDISQPYPEQWRSLDDTW